MDYHRPVLVDDVMKILIGPPGLYLDGTLGHGGHAAALLERCPDCRVLGLDVDEGALEVARARLTPYAGRVRMSRRSFRDVGGEEGIGSEGLAGALLDLGVSSLQLDRDERGFTFRRGAPLDMRMNPLGGMTAAAFLASAPKSELVKALRAGEAPRPSALASRIVERRRERPLSTSDDLVAALQATLGRRASHAEKARVFQALRMHLNEEIAALEEALPAIRDLMVPGAALVVISYHSIEDRIVKRAFADWSDPSRGLPPRLPVRAAELHPLGGTIARGAVTPSVGEIEANPRASSAKMRAWRKAA